LFAQEYDESPFFGTFDTKEVVDTLKKVIACWKDAWKSRLKALERVQRGSGEAQAAAEVVRDALEDLNERYKSAFEGMHIAVLEGALNLDLLRDGLEVRPPPLICWSGLGRRRPPLPSVDRPLSQTLPSFLGCLSARLRVSCSQSPATPPDALALPPSPSRAVFFFLPRRRRGERRRSWSSWWPTAPRACRRCSTSW
jgi:hypothetical protein